MSLRPITLRGVASLVIGFGWASLAGFAAGMELAHARLEAVLKSRVSEGRVDYAGLKSHPTELDRYLESLAQTDRAEFNAWPEADRLAFLINAYNAYTLRLIRDHYPLRSIRDIGNLLKGPWDQPVVRIYGETLSLDALEHQVIRRDYREPRIHFALVCAAKGCPPLRAEAYVGARLETQLNDQTRAFLADSSKNRVEVATKTVFLSPIFKWYQEDFDRHAGSVLAALKPHWPELPATTDGFRIRYTEYDWTLNDRPSGRTSP